jgi:hypothetical protein
LSFIPHTNFKHATKESKKAHDKSASSDGVEPSWSSSSSSSSSSDCRYSDEQKELREEKCSVFWRRSMQRGSRLDDDNDDD